MVNGTASEKRKYIIWISYLLSGASYAVFVVLIGVVLLFFILELSGYKLLLVLYIGGIPIGILPGFSKSVKHLKEFLILFFMGSLICSSIGFISIDWQNNHVSPIILLYGFLANIELIIVAVITYFIRMKMMRKRD